MRGRTAPRRRTLTYRHAEPSAMFVYSVLRPSEPPTSDITCRHGRTSVDTLTVGDIHSAVDPIGSTRTRRAPPAARADCGSERRPSLRGATLPSLIRLDGADGIAYTFT